MVGGQVLDIAEDRPAALDYLTRLHRHEDGRADQGRLPHGRHRRRRRRAHARGRRGLRGRRRARFPDRRRHARRDGQRQRDGQAHRRRRRRRPPHLPRGGGAGGGARRWRPSTWPGRWAPCAPSRAPMARWPRWPATPSNARAEESAGAARAGRFSQGPPRARGRASCPRCARRCARRSSRSAARWAATWALRSGAVELIVALHRAFKSPVDRLVFDVGHQAYAHKLLTGRRARMSTLRQEGGLAPVPRPHGERARRLRGGPRLYRALGGAGDPGGKAAPAAARRRGGDRR